MTENAVPPASTRRRLRLLSIIVPLAGLALLYPIRLLLLRAWPAPVVDSLVGLLMLAGVLTFSWLVFRILARQDEELARQHAELARRYQTECRLRDQLEGVEQAAIAIASAASSTQILQQLTELAREIIPAHYAALGVLDAHGGIDSLYTAGLSAAERDRLGPLPQGHGLLDITLTEGRALRIADLRRDPRHGGLPPGHPELTNLLAVPIQLAERTMGNLYLADRAGDGSFTEEDERLLMLLAGHAAVAIEQGRLSAQLRRLAVSAERERIRLSLQDGAIQALYAVTLDLELALEDLTAQPDAAAASIERSLTRVEGAMVDIRRCILGKELAEAPPVAIATAAREESYV